LLRCEAGTPITLEGSDYFTTMSPQDQALTELLLSVATESDLRQVAGRFLDLAENETFMAACKPTHNKMVSQIVSIGLKSKLGIDASGLDLRLLHYSRFDFFHGAGLVGNHIVQCFYFRRENKGCITVSTLSGEVHYLRISAVALPVPEKPSQN